MSKEPIELTGDFDKTLLAAEVAGTNKLGVRFADEKLDAFRENIEQSAGTGEESKEVSPSGASIQLPKVEVSVPLLVQIDQSFDPL